MTDLERLRDELEEYDELLRVAWNQRDTLLAALREIGRYAPPDGGWAARAQYIARSAIAKVEGEK